LDKIGNELREQAEAHFMRLEQAIAACKALLIQQINGKIVTLGAELELLKIHATASVQGCTHMINIASQLLNTLPDNAIRNLQTINTLPIINTVLPLVKLVFSGNIVSDITNYGDVIIGECTVVAGKSELGYQDGIGVNALFSWPGSVAYNPKDGSCYVSDTGNNRIRKVSAQGVVTTFAGTGEAGFADGLATSAKFNYPSGVAVNHKTGDIYVNDRDNYRIRKITPQGLVTTFVGTGSSGAVDGQGVSASFSSLSGIDMNQSDGSLYVADYGNCKVRKITIQGVVSTFAGTTSGFEDGNISVAKLNNPMGITVESGTGDVFVTENGNHRVRKITSSGIVSTVAGGACGYVDGTGTTASFFNPYAVQFNNRDGSLLVADMSNNKIRKNNKTRSCIHNQLA